MGKLGAPHELAHPEERWPSAGRRQPRVFSTAAPTTAPNTVIYPSSPGGTGGSSRHEKPPFLIISIIPRLTCVGRIGDTLQAEHPASPALPACPAAARAFHLEVRDASDSFQRPTSQPNEPGAAVPGCARERGLR